MLKWRLISASLVLSLLVLLLVCDYQRIGFARSGVWLVPLVFAIAIMATRELLDLMTPASELTAVPDSGGRNLEIRPMAWSTYVGTSAIVAGACVPMLWRSYPVDCPLGKFGWPLMGLGLGIGLAFLGEMRRFQQPGGITVRLASGILTMAYAGVLVSFLVALRQFHSHEWGMAALVSTIAIVKMSDTGAYFTGRLLGRHPLTPLLSPKKTIEGAAGGILASVLTSWLMLNVVTPALFVPAAVPQPALRWTTLGTVLALVAMFGDLAESLLKRDLGKKDSSRWLPGLGGILDMIDSLLFAAPVAYLCWAAGLVGPLTAIPP
ncbi:MAG: CDP-archaeol synthase [Planctomycetes bacterium]|nr:CDP-archaeol synthase [Planctomycetota bacterium]